MLEHVERGQDVEVLGGKRELFDGRSDDRRYAARLAEAERIGRRVEADCTCVSREGREVRSRTAADVEKTPVAAAIELVPDNLFDKGSASDVPPIEVFEAVHRLVFMFVHKPWSVRGSPATPWTVIRGR